MMEPEHFSLKSHAINSLRKMRSLYLQKQLTDVTLVVSDVEISAHRIVLSAASDYFLAMFTGNLAESTMSRIQMENIDPEILQALVDFCYSGKVELRVENVEKYLLTANILQMNEVVKACCDFLLKHLHPSNCIGFSLFSESQGCIEFHKIAHKYLMDNFSDVITNQEFLDLSEEDLKKLLSSELINVPSEEEAYNALISWVNYDLTNRKESFVGLINAIKIPFLNPEMFLDMSRNPLFQQNVSCIQLIIEAMTYHLFPDQRFTLDSYRTKPRKSTAGALFVLGGTDGVKGSLKLENYDFRNNLWHHYDSMTSLRLQFGTSVIGKKVYVSGGRDGLKTLNVVECYDFNTNSWSDIPSMSTHRHGLGMAVLGGQMYAVGGHDGWTFLSSVERWDPVTNQWSYVTPMNTQRCTVGVAVLKDKLYAVGGRDSSSCLNTVECFDPHKNKWEYCAPMNMRRGGVGVVTINECLYAVGGHDAPLLHPGISRFDSVERYDPNTNLWTLVAPMNIGRDAVGIAVLGNCIIAVGGYDGQHYLNTVESYDPWTNQWEEMKPLSHGRAGMCAAVVKL